MHRRGGSCRRCCASAVPRALEIHDGDGKGAGRVGVDETNDGLQLVAPSIGLASRCQAVEKGEGRTCMDYL